MVYVPGHRKGTWFEARGISLADEEAKRVALELGIPIFHLTPSLPKIMISPSFSEKEKEQLQQLGAQLDAQGRWEGNAYERNSDTPTPRKPLGTSGHVRHSLRGLWVCQYLHNGQTGNRRFLTCKKTNKRALQKTATGGRSPGLSPFQSIQIDYTERPKIGRLKYLLVIVDHLTHWVEATPLPSATVNYVTKALLEQIIPQFGMVENIDSENGSHFTAQITKGLSRELDIKWLCHTPWHPPSSGRIERMNQTLKAHLTKLILETQLPWTKYLPIALLRIRTAPRKDVSLSLYEMLYGFPYLGRSSDLPTFETKDQFLRSYVFGLSFSLHFLRQKGLLAQALPHDFLVHSQQPGDYVLIKSWKEDKLQPT